MLSWKDKSVQQLLDEMHNVIAEVHDLPLGRLPPVSYTVMPNGNVSVGYDISRFVHSLDASYYTFNLPRTQITQQLTLDLPE